jgi:hypothetical protein
MTRHVRSVKLLNAAWVLVRGHAASDAPDPGDATL